ncbi:hypothetical protein L2E82_06101 [Cichorium intybus]|uniref:Uncharacterized protein n=1 Tax=Cichorium intybus TaxID=13427 RepID=A0ACB9H9K4_CICIN|nr:hypothetical protein L2E82_06101 [Cichorium intybus]
MENMVKFGPKSMTGSIWDEGGKSKILQILISHGNNCINSIQFVYVVDKKVLRSEVHGGSNGFKFDIVTFDHSGEYLVSVSGQYSSGRLASIAFGTNNRTYGPFGRANSSYYDDFVYNFRHKSSFGGFYGSVFNSFVYAIGVYVKPLGSLAETETGSVKSEDD